MLEDSLIKRLKEYRGVSHLKRAAINILVKMSSEEDMQPITEYFKKVDTDGTGMININELTNFLKQNNTNLTKEEIKSIIREIDYAGNGMINYSEFLSATIDI